MVWNTLQGCITLAHFQKLEKLLPEDPDKDSKVVFRVTFSTDMHAKPGDTFYIFAPNDSALVKQLLDLFNTPPTLQITKKKATRYLPPFSNPVFVQFNKFRPFGIGELLTFALDIKTPSSFMKKTFFLYLIPLLPTDSPAKAKLEFICDSNSGSSKAAYADLLSSHLDLYSFLCWAFPKTAPPLAIQDLLEFLSPLFGRQYSLSSISMNKHHDGGNMDKAEDSKISIIFNREPYGHCTMWLSSLAVLRSEIPFLLRQRPFFSVDNSLKLVMISHGTAIAPFHSFLQHFSGLDQAIRPCFIWLIYGCRDPDHFILKKEIFELKDLLSVNLSIAYSRHPLTEKRKWVQDILLEHKDQVLEILGYSNTKVLICGEGSTMVPGVISTLEQIAGKDTIRLCQESGRIISERWIS